MKSSLSRSQKYNLSAFVILIILLTVAASTSAQRTHHVVYVLQEVETIRNITNMTLQVKETHLETGKQIIITEYLASNLVELYLSPGEYEIELIADDPLTTGKDYFFMKKATVISDSKETIYLFPIASLRGTAVDRLNNLVDGAEIKLDCDKDFISSAPIKTDKFGSFTVPAVPTGNCIITASSKDYFDQQQLAFNKGDFESMHLELQRQASGRISPAIFFLIGVAVTIIIVVVGSAAGIYWWRTHRIQHKKPTPAARAEITKKKDKTNPSSQDEKQLSKRAEDILRTLRERERVIVQFLLDNEFTSTQSKMKHATKIPKTSLTRIIVSLQQKNIVTVEVMGSMKTIKLTDWFLEK